MLAYEDWPLTPREKNKVIVTRCDGKLFHPLYPHPNSSVCGVKEFTKSNNGNDGLVSSCTGAVITHAGFQSFTRWDSCLTPTTRSRQSGTITRQ